MKKNSFKKLLLLLFAVALCNYGQAQLINPDFLQNNGNDDASFNCPTFQGGSVGGGPGTLVGWYRAWGTPLLVNDCNGTIGTVKLSATAASGIGQGITQEYEFKKGVTYQICYRLNRWDMSNTDPNTQQAYDAVLAFSLNENAPILPTSLCGPNCECLFPSSSVTGNKQTHIITKNNLSMHINTNCSEAYSGSFTIVANEDFNYLSIALIGGSYSHHDDNYVELDFVNVIKPCRANPDLVISANGNVAPGYYDAYKTIKAGTSFGGAPGSVNITPHNSTGFEAKNYILFQENFFAQIDPGHEFIAIINPNTCTEDCFASTGGGTGGSDDPVEDGDHPSSKPLKVDNIDDNRTSIYPNPNNGSFTIEFSKKGIFDVKVINLLGTTVYTTTINNEQKKTIQLNSSLPPGTYIIQLEGEGTKHYEKIMLIK